MMGSRLTQNKTTHTIDGSQSLGSNRIRNLGRVRVVVARRGTAWSGTARYHPMLPLCFMSGTVRYQPMSPICFISYRVQSAVCTRPGMLHVRSGRLSAYPHPKP
eukprot:2024956-Rhodomonas_salina.2